MAEVVDRESDKFALRLPQGMRDTIKMVAARNRRSMNAEMIYLIERAMESVYGCVDPGKVAIDAVALHDQREFRDAMVRASFAKGPENASQ